MRAYIPNHKEEYVYPDEMEKILNYLNPDWVEDIVMLSGKKGFP